MTLGDSNQSPATSAQAQLVFWNSLEPSPWQGGVVRCCGSSGCEDQDVKNMSNDVKTYGKTPSNCKQNREVMREYERCPKLDPTIEPQNESK